MGRRIGVFLVCFIVAMIVMIFVMNALVDGKYDGRIPHLIVAFAAGIYGALKVKPLEPPPDYPVVSNEQSNGEWLALVAGLPDRHIIKGVFEWIELRKGSAEWRYQSSELWAYFVAVADREMIIGRAACASWDAYERATPEILSNDQLRLRKTIGIDEIASLELTSLAEFTGRDWVRTWFGRPKIAKIKERHPKITFYDKWRGSLEWKTTRVVYIFTREGDRLIITQTFDRDLAVKVHAKLKFLMEDLNKQTKARAQSDDQDYL